ncbi:electron transport complex subunit E [Oscillospiraceae bacterium 50-16]|nr:electron transport complex subunit E [Lawsonibacter sp.]
MSEKKSKASILTNGILNENPVLRLVLGTCPTLAVTTMASNGIGMGLAATFVLLCSNIVISALRKVIPNQVRIPCYITVIAGFVSVVQMVVKAYVPDLDKALGVYLPLIVVNCIILGRAEMFASKNGILDSALDGIGMGIGFTITLTIMGSIREIIGSGTWMAGLGKLIPSLGADFSIQVIPESIDTFSLMTSAPGGFFVFGVLMAGAAWLTNRPKKEAAEGGNA